MALTYLGTLDPVYILVRPHCMRSSIVSSILETFFEDYCSWGDIWHYNSGLRSICPSCSVETDRLWLLRRCAEMKGRGGYQWTLWPWWYQRRTKRFWSRMRRWLCGLLLLLQRGRTKYQCPFWKGSQREVYMSLPLFQMMSVWDVSLSSFKCSSSNRTQVQFCFSTTHSNRYYIISYIIYFSCLDYRFHGNWSHDWEPRYYVLFYFCDIL